MTTEQALAASSETERSAEAESAPTAVDRRTGRFAGWLRWFGIGPGAAPADVPAEAAGASTRAVQDRPAAFGPLNLALQGGGAHGAFSWGVLDALLADPRIRFEGLSGSSAGAMNAVVLADGWLKGGREGARSGLAAFWTEVGKQMPWTMVTQGEGDAIRLAPASKWLAKWAG